MKAMARGWCGGEDDDNREMAGLGGGCMVTTGALTAYLRGYADLLIPPGAWHGLLSKIFVVIVWPSLAWFAMFCSEWRFGDFPFQ